ncbi:MAG: UvrD-helicase domain-containing protein [Bacteroidaceae bacterium]|nr:UvrD-helicase domain-containing protein [Bacteroidaceae bacterium]
MNTDELLEGFNQAQKEAVLYCDGPSLVIAGAGSGKTRVLTYKIAYLLSLGYEPWSILALTFTNKAADEMKQRIAAIVGEDMARHLWMGTFHSVFLRILHVEHERIGFSSNFTIYDASDSKNLIKSIIKEMGLDDKTYRPSAVASRISMAKNQLQDAESYYQSNDDYATDAVNNTPLIREIYRRYASRCRQSDAMDFDDILLFTYRLLSSNPDLLHKYEHSFHYVLVDEYQDTNYAQHSIVWLLTRNHQNVCVVGDDAQSIYSFRGANIDNILHFNSQYSRLRIFKLEQNYRSTQMIVNAANSLIHKNRGQIFKNVFSELDKGERIRYAKVQSDIVEGEYVARRINSLVCDGQADYSDFAILYRTNAQSRVFEEAFRKQNIPYRVYGGLSFYQRKEIKDAIAYFRVVVNPNDEEAIKRIINYPARGIGQTTVSRIIDTAVSNNISLWTVIASPQSYGLTLHAGILSKLSRFSMMIQSFIDDVNTSDALMLGRRVLEESKVLQDIYQDRTPENLSRQQNIQELINGLSEFVEDRTEQGNSAIHLSDYLSEVSLVSDIDSDKKDDSPKVSVMTIHSAKGLEFDTVFVVGLEEDLFPNQMASSSQRELEEERRLFYVAITRAKHRCFLTSAMQRYRFGQMEFSRPSRFINDIDSRFIQTVSSSSSNTSSSSFSRPSSPFISKPMKPHSDHHLVRVGSARSAGHVPHPQPTDMSCGFSSGQRVHHDRFGNGIIKEVDGVGDNAKAVVDFDEVGNKRLLLKYAHLTSI